MRRHYLFAEDEKERSVGNGKANLLKLWHTRRLAMIEGDESANGGEANALVVRELTLMWDLAKPMTSILLSREGYIGFFARAAKALVLPMTSDTAAIAVAQRDWEYDLEGVSSINEPTTKGMSVLDNEMMAPEQFREALMQLAELVLPVESTAKIFASFFRELRNSVAEVDAISSNEPETNVGDPADRLVLRPLSRIPKISKDAFLQKLPPSSDALRAIHGLQPPDSREMSLKQLLLSYNPRKFSLTRAFPHKDQSNDSIDESVSNIEEIKTEATDDPEPIVEDDMVMAQRLHTELLGENTDEDEDMDRIFQDEHLDALLSGCVVPRDTALAVLRLEATRSLLAGVGVIMDNVYPSDLSAIDNPDHRIGTDYLVALTALPSELEYQLGGSELAPARYHEYVTRMQRELAVSRTIASTDSYHLVVVQATQSLSAIRDHCIQVITGTSLGLLRFSVSREACPVLLPDDLIAAEALKAQLAKLDASSGWMLTDLPLTRDVAAVLLEHGCVPDAILLMDEELTAAKEEAEVISPLAALRRQQFQTEKAGIEDVSQALGGTTRIINCPLFHQPTETLAAIERELNPLAPRLDNIEDGHAPQMVDEYYPAAIFASPHPGNYEEDEGKFVSLSQQDEGDAPDPEAVAAAEAARKTSLQLQVPLVISEDEAVATLLSRWTDNLPVPRRKLALTRKKEKDGEAGDDGDALEEDDEEEEPPVDLEAAREDESTRLHEQFVEDQKMLDEAIVSLRSRGVRDEKRFLSAATY
ncbi:hypothetical protein JM16_001468 [Phytophthora kernoviae]|uniref:Uncharacterized protein n=1 Tax=Phytophthora kernoviae TaxID=325452 RepID=A0A8T0M9D0_9STRA|nr:hypothetical protein JM16_001468 [Phytophthora kernoviae]